jgi:hypothetical protein
MTVTKLDTKAKTLTYAIVTNWKKVRMPTLRKINTIMCCLYVDQTLPVVLPNLHSLVLSSLILKTEHIMRKFDAVQNKDMPAKSVQNILKSAQNGPSRIGLRTFYEG